MNRTQRRKEERLKKKTKVEETYEISYNLHRPWADLLFETKLPPMVLESMIELSDKVYVHQCSLQKAPSPDQFTYLESIKKDIAVDLQSIWIVEQHPGEYNPIHTHTNCDISAVMYLKVPEFLPSEKPERDDDGIIYFIGDCGVPNELKLSSIKSKPSPGAFFIFPSHMMHTVYPYKTNDNFARRSVSFNAKFEYKK